MFKYISKVLYILSGRLGHLAALLLILIFSSCLEALGVGLIGPFLKIASAPELVNEVTIVSGLYKQLNMDSPEQFIPVLGLIVGVIFCLRSAMYFLSRSYIFHFSYTQKRLLISKLLNAYLKVHYTFHLDRNTASLIKNVIVEVNHFTDDCLVQLLYACSNVIITIALLVLLAKVSPVLLLLMAGSILPIILFLTLFKEKFMKWGEIRSKTNKEMIRIMNHGLGSIKETRIIGCESFFSREMSLQGKTFARVSTLFMSSQLMPRIIIESFTVVFIIMYISLYQIFTQKSIQDLTPILGIFSVAAIRLIPSSSEFMRSIGRMQNARYSLNTLYEDLKVLDKQDAKKIKSISNHIVPSNYSKDIFASQSSLNFQNNIEISSVIYSYPGTENAAINDISLTIKKGQSIALVGKSGSGKTTLVDIILGLLTPESGDIRVDGKSIYTNLRAWQNFVGYIPQAIFLIDDTVERNIAFGVPDHLIDRNRLENAIESAQLQELISQLPKGVHTNVGERGIRLSGGQRQRIGIARALYHEREILILDEATSALDSETEQQISQAINALVGSKTLIIIAHRLSTIEHCDLVYRLEDGQVIQQGKYGEVINNYS